MEFSFGTRRWVPEELLQQESDETNDHSLGLHIPGFYDKILNVNKCLLQGDPANQVFWFIVFILHVDYAFKAVALCE